MTTDYTLSKTFWKCIDRTDWPDFIDVSDYILEIVGIPLNTLTLVLLSKKQSGPRISLILLRGMVASYLLSTVINFLSDVYPHTVRTGNYHFNRLVCLLWTSRFFYWIFSVMGGMFLALFAVDRYAILAQLDRFRITVPEYRVPSYVVFVVTSSLLLALPQLLTVNLQGDTCDCAPIQVNIPFLAFVYAHVYIWFSLLLVFEGSILAFITAQLIRWRQNWLPANHNWRPDDDLNALTLKRPAELRMQKRTKKDPGNCSARDDKRRSWSSASFCILPLTASYVLTHAYDSIYQFLSAVGLTTFIINSPEQRVGALLLLVHSTAVPLILCFYIPSLRVYLQSLWKRAFTQKANPSES
ncbi:hypothetical protein SprV_0902674100 [Sparganum proliferum]